MIRALVMEIREELAEPDKRIAAFNRRIRTLFRNNEACQRIGCIEGIGPVTADLASGRRHACGVTLKLVPRQRSSGGKAQLFGRAQRP